MAQMDKENLRLLEETAPTLGEAHLLLGYLGGAAPEEFRTAILFLKTTRLQDRAEREARDGR